MNKILIIFIIFMGGIISYIIIINLIAKIDLSVTDKNYQNSSNFSNSATITGLTTSTSVSFTGKRFYGYFEGTSDSKGRTVNAYLLNTFKLPLETKTVNFRKSHEIFFTLFPLLFIITASYILIKDKLIKKEERL